MSTFGKRLRDCRKERGFSQNEVAKLLNTNHSVIGKYERDDVNPSIDAVKRLAELLDTTVAYLVGEADTNELFKNADMLRRLKDISELPQKERDALLLTVDAFLRDSKTKKAYA